jgi:hypothetical protein
VAARVFVVRFFLARSILEVLPVVAALVRLGAPRRDDAPFVIRLVGIDHCDFEAVDQADGIDPSLAVVEAIIHPFEGRTFENAGRVGKGYAVDRQVAAVLCFVPSVSHRVYLHNVNIQAKGPCNCALRTSFCPRVLVILVCFRSRVGTTVCRPLVAALFHGGAGREPKSPLLAKDARNGAPFWIRCGQCQDHNQRQR